MGDRAQRMRQGRGTSGRVTPESSDMMDKLVSGVDGR